MKLLLDHNLPPSLINSLSNLYPGSLHVRTVGLDKASDSEIWAYAAKHNFVIASKDSDFYHRSMLLGHPPKVVWIRLGNCSTSDIRSLLVASLTELLSFESDPDGSFMILSWDEPGSTRS
jgi:predicted nuclease of predicted toxin-antitoxin system